MMSQTVQVPLKGIDSGFLLLSARPLESRVFRCFAREVGVILISVASTPHLDPLRALAPIHLDSQYGESISVSPLRYPSLYFVAVSENLGRFSIHSCYKHLRETFWAAGQIDSEKDQNVKTKQTSQTGQENDGC